MAVCALAGNLFAGAGDQEDPAHHLLLTPQRIKRLRRDKERATPRWTNFETRVLAGDDSPERGFELALYYVVVGDKKTAEQAMAWAKAHRAERRQISLILDWCRSGLIDTDAAQLSSMLSSGGGAGNKDLKALRDDVFAALAAGKELPSSSGAAWKSQLDELKKATPKPEIVYALCEFLDVVRRATHQDLRQEDTDFFSNLPAELLLAVKPKDLDNSPWQMRAAALALVSLDPNLVNSQFLQGWAMEDQQMIREGPGVGYELLWGNPYLPGVSYQNLDPWLYDREGRLFARSDWQPNACWISITSTGVKEENCPPAWHKTPTQFGRLLLIPTNGECVDVHLDTANRSLIVWGFAPNQRLTFHNYEKKKPGQADAGGMFHLPFSASGKVCPRGQ